MTEVRAPKATIKHWMSIFSKQKKICKGILNNQKGHAITIFSIESLPEFSQTASSGDSSLRKFVIVHCNNISIWNVILQVFSL